MQFLLAVSRFIDAINERLGYIADWAVVLSCVISAGNAMVRYAFDTSSNAWLEIQWYLFTATVMLGASYTLKKNEHVRVDITYMMLSERGKEWLDLLGTLLFLLPTMSFLAWLSWPLFERAWTSNEVSGSAGGLTRWYVLILLPLGFALVALQGVSEVIKRAAALMGVVRFETHYERPVQ
ncbi:MAG TPA: TRAP transporter small permease subunit [Usitatibacter sp.]|nr:TRAP transporter small permease subunit [Usitatibacter sp.]